jgi:hypothetical protein
VSELGRDRSETSSRRGDSTDATDRRLARFDTTSRTLTLTPLPIDGSDGWLTFGDQAVWIGYPAQ